MSTTPQVPSQQERINAMLIHVISAFAAPFLAPLIGYFIFQPKNDFAYRQAREGLNFQISVIIYSTVLAVSIVGLIVLPILLVAAWILLILAAVNAYQGTEFRFPLTIRFIKN